MFFDWFVCSMHYDKNDLKNASFNSSSDSIRVVSLCSPILQIRKFRQREVSWLS